MFKFYRLLLICSIGVCLSACQQLNSLDSAPIKPAIILIKTPVTGVTPNEAAPIPITVTTTEPATVTTTNLLATTYQLHLDKPDYISWVVADDTYIYWATEKSAAFYRYPLVGGQIEIVASSHYENGMLALSQPLLSGDWLIFLDAKVQLLFTPFILRAFNLRSGVEIEIISDQEEGAATPGFAVSGDWVVWTRLEKGKTLCSDESVLVVYDLKRREQRELDRVCIDNNYMWEFNSTIGIAGNYVIAAQFFSDALGNGRHIQLFDLTTDQATELTAGAYGRMPALNGDWAAWLHMRNPNDVEGNTIALNLKTGVRKEITPPIFSDEPFIVANRWLYWDGLGGNQLAVYDLMTDKMYTMPTTMRTEEDISTGGWYISDRTIAWSENIMNPAKPGEFDVYLHWLTGADPKTLITQQQPSP